MSSFSYRFLFAASLYLSNPLVAATEAAPSPSADAVLQQNIDLSEAETNNWLDQLDKGRYEESWDNGSLMFRNTIKKDEWKKTMDKIRKPLGAVNTRSNLDVRTAKDPQGLPAGDYMVFFYKTSFANKKEAFELITLVKESDGKWKVLTYQVN